jgi:hypothetical protein
VPTPDAHAQDEDAPPRGGPSEVAGPLLARLYVAVCGGGGRAVRAADAKEWLWIRRSGDKEAAAMDKEGAAVDMERVRIRTGEDKELLWIRCYCG